MQRKRTVLVTGGGGFVGSHLVRALCGQGDEVYVAELPAADMRRIANLSGVYVHRVDIADRAGLEAIFARVQPALVFHLAAYGVNAHQKDFDRALSVNVRGMANLMLCAAEHGSPRVVSLGSCAEYGNHAGPVAEDAPLRPETVYGATKAAATLCGHALAAQHGLSMATLRPFGLFGEGEERHKLFCQVMTALLRGEDVRLSDCTQSRDYLYVQNLTDALLLAGDSCFCGILNVGSGKAYPLSYYLEKIRERIGGGGRLLYGALPHRKGDLWSPCANANAIARELGWEPRVSLDEGLDRTIAWFRDHSLT